MIERLRAARQRLIMADFRVYHFRSTHWNDERIGALAEWHAAVKEYWREKR